MIKKTIVLSSLILAVVLLSGCAKKGTENKNGDKKETAQKEENGGMINSIKDAIGMGKKMECTYTYKAGEGNESFTSKAYIEGKKYKSESEVMGKKQLMVFDGETMYTWSEADKKGTKWVKSCLDELNKDDKTEKTDSNTTIPKEENIDDASEVFDDAMDTKCVPVDSIDFSVPSDIVFSDMCEQLKAMKESLGKNLPKGVSIPKGAGEPSL